MPAQVLSQAFVEPVFLLAVHIQVIAERPRDDHVEIAIGQVHAAARAEGETEGDNDGEALQPARHGQVLANAWVFMWTLDEPASSANQ
ncbi:hypothetical protein D3C87_2004160 [compost metagenome]